MPPSHPRQPQFGVEGSSYYEPVFMTGEEADREMAQSRKEIRKTVLGESDDEEEVTSD